MESVLWAFKQLWDKGLAYQGYRVLPYCWHDRTPLSNHELKMDDDVYQDRQDNTVTVGLRLEEPLRQAPSAPSWSSSGPPRPGPCPPTWPSPWAPTSST